MAKETEFAAGACLAVGTGKERRYFSGGDPVNRADFPEARFDLLLGRGSIIQRGAAGRNIGGGSSATTQEDLEAEVDREGRARGKGHKK